MNSNNIYYILFNIPYDILNKHIYNILPYYTILWFNKDNYIKYHDHIFNKIKYNNLNAYIKFIFKNDLIFPLKQITTSNLYFIQNFFYKINYQKYIFNNICYKSYYSFILDYCITNNSSNCRNYIINYNKSKIKSSNVHLSNISSFNKKQHKKVKIKNNKWRN